MTDHADLPQTLTDRVAARVVDARLALERRASATHPKVRRSRPKAGASSTNGKTPDEVREAESLKRVFRDMGVSYRRYRRQAGGPVVPGLRDAALEFRADPSLSSLMAVAVYLDKLDLLN
jgi:hypothetical protein